MNVTQIRLSQSGKPEVGEWSAEAIRQGEFSGYVRCVCGEVHEFHNDLVELTGHVEAPCGRVLVLMRWGLLRAMHDVSTQIADPKYGPWSRT